ncbi:MAG: membrane dipeptidase [Chloroflexi bacterium]|nr:membrane dipeptidase [Chloroflexota bacterium]
MTDIIVDAHQDIAWNFFNNGRDFRQSAWAQRRTETDPVFLQHYGYRMVGLPEALIGRVALTCGTIFVSPRSLVMYSDEKIYYETPQEAYRLGVQQLDYYHRLSDEEPRIRLIRSQTDLDEVLASWDNKANPKNRLFGLVILMEGADPILEPAQVEEWYERGLRVIGPAWSSTRYSGGTKALGPLTYLGRELLENMAGFGMILDLAHMAPQACYEALGLYEGPLFSSHANPLKFCPDRPDRNLSDEMIRLIAERDGVMGVMPFNMFLVPGWQMGDRKDAATMDTFIAVIDHICQVTGSARHVGIGSDLDGGFGAESAPVGFDSVANLWDIGPALAARGYAAADISAILSGNFLRILRAGLPTK